MTLALCEGSRVQVGNERITITTGGPYLFDKLPWALIKFLDLESGRLFDRGWALVKFSPLSASEVCLFCNKTINGTNKTRRSNNARFL